METRIVTTEAALAELAAPWRQLEAALPDLPPQASHAYVSAWAKHRGDADLHVVVAEDHGELIGVLPLMVASRSLGPLRWRELAHLVEGDHRDAIVDDRRVSASSTVKALFTAALEGADGVRRVSLRYLPETSPLTSHLFRSSEWNPRVRPLVEIPRVNLAAHGSFTQYRRTVPRSSLTSLNKMRRELRLEVAEVSPVPASLYDECVALHRRQKDVLVSEHGRSERRSLFEDPRRAAAYRELVVGTPFASAFIARSGDGDLLFHELAWRRDRHVWAWNTAYEPHAGKHRPSRARIAMIEDLFARGDTDVYDLGAGRYPWKFELTAEFTLSYETTWWCGDDPVTRALRRVRP